VFERLGERAAFGVGLGAGGAGEGVPAGSRAFEPGFDVDAKWECGDVEALGLEGGAEALDVGLVPHTLQGTSLGKLRSGDPVNPEVDVLAKYVERLVGATLPA